MTAADEERLRDILESISAIRRHATHRPTDETVRDAILYRFVVIGEAVRAMSDGAKKAEPVVPWGQIVRMRDMVTHQYFRVDFDIVSQVIRRDLAGLEAAVRRLLAA